MNRCHIHKTFLLDNSKLYIRIERKLFLVVKYFFQILKIYCSFIGFLSKKLFYSFSNNFSDHKALDYLIKNDVIE